MLKQKYYASGEFRVSPLAECQFADVSDSLDVNEQTVFLKLPSLIRGYLKLGLWTARVGWSIRYR